MLAVLLAGACAAPESSQFDHDSLEKAENLSEKLANDLLAMSVSLRDRDFERALQSLNRVVSRRNPMSPEQRQAVMDSYHHVLKAVDQEPALDTPALYQSMAELNYRLHGEN